VVEEIDPEGRVTHREYDLRRRLVAEENGAGDRTEHGYDGSGNRTSMRRPEGGEWRYVYDEADRLVGVEDPLGHTSYDYDAADNLVEIVDAEGSSTRYEHDAHDRRVAVVRADGSREESAYDASGNRIARVDPKGQLTEWEYDALGREVSRSYAAPEEPSGDDLERTESAYDPNGNVVQVDEVYGGATSTRTTRFGYDTFDRVERVETPEGTLLYGYDAKGNRTRLRDADGRETLYAYDALDRVVTVTGPTGSVRSSYFRDSRLREVRHLGGAAGDTTATNEYDAAGRISAIWNRQGAALVSSYRYQYDHNGNRLVQEEQNGGDVEVTSYLYDAADRLVEVAYPERLVAYGYDGVANRVTERVAGVPGGEVLSDKAYRYDSRHRLLEISDAISGVISTFAWDANGNQRSRITTGDGGDEQLEYLYDSRDRLTEIRRGGLLLTTHRYDFRGLRFRKSGPDGVERFLWDGDRLLQERDDALNTAARYEWGSGRLLAMEHAEEGRRSYLFDGLGSVVDLVQPDGTLAARYQWDAWGEERRTIGESANRFGFTGHQREAESGLYYAKARFYDAGTGRFLREDPVEGDVAEPITLHDYVYARGNPIVWVDPSGEVPILGNVVGGAASVGFGWAVSKLTGEEYTWKDAGIDFGLGAATFGLSAVNKFWKLGKVGQAATRVASEATLDIGAEALRAEVHGEDITAGRLATGGFANTAIGEGGALVAKSLKRLFPRARGNIDVEPPPMRYQVEGVVVREGSGLDLEAGAMLRRSATPELPSTPSRTATPEYQLLQRHPSDPEIPGGSTNYRGRYNAALHAEGLARLPDSWDVHHSIPQQLRGDPRIENVDIDSAPELRGVQGYRHPGAETNAHSVIDQEWRRFIRGNPNATTEELLGFREYIDWRFQHVYWEQRERARYGGR
jgi:RHS repeat-associated protein